MQNVSRKRKAPEDGAKANKKSKGNQGGPNPPAQKPRRPRQQSAAAAYATQQVGKGAQVQQSKDSIRVRHREFIGNVTGSVNFTVALTFAVNPGIASSFPWLSGIAQNWETYRFRSLRLCSYTRTGSNVPGSILLAHDPDSSDDPPSSEQVMSTYESLVEDAPWKDMCLNVAKVGLKDIGPRKFIRTAALAANQDIKLYDSGNLFVATVDGTAVAWSKLWVEYDVELYTPQLPPAGFVASGTITNAGGVGCAAATPLGTSRTILGNLISSATSAGLVSFQNLTVGGEYQVTFMAAGYAAFTPAAFSAATGLTLKNSFVTVAGVGGAAGSMVATYTATASVGSLQLNTTALTTPANVMYTIVPIAPSAL